MFAHCNPKGSPSQHATLMGTVSKREKTCLGLTTEECQLDTKAKIEALITKGEAALKSDGVDTAAIGCWHFLIGNLQVKLESMPDE